MCRSPAVGQQFLQAQVLCMYAKQDITNVAPRLDVVTLDHTKDLQDEVNQFVFLEESEPEGAADERRDQLMLVFENALIALDQEGFFGSGHDRDKVVLK